LMVFADNNAFWDVDKMNCGQGDGRSSDLKWTA